MPADSRTLEDEGVVIPPTRLDRRASSRELAGRMRNPRQREADLRAQLAAGRAGAERVAALIERFGLDTLPGRARGDARLRRAPHARPHRRARRTGVRERERRARGAPTATSSCGCEATRRRATRSTLDFAGSADAARRQPQLPARRDAVRLLLRPARAHRPRRAALRRRLPPAHGDRARGLAAERAAARRRGGRATSRPRRAWPTSCWPPSATRSARAR